MPRTDGCHPTRPESGIARREAVPVVQVAWEGAVAYATWSGERPPTEAAWPYVARGGRRRA